ncbi:MAG: RNA polymerase sigma factor [Lachnospiraceae bacterium]|nr:RNA polymerase sigma factor [Lachnospiraceae bacterium]
MNSELLRTDKDLFSKIYHKYVDTIYRISFSFLKNEDDAKDAVQEVFIKLLNSKKEYENEEHLKAWLIVTTSNYCKNIVSNWWWKRKTIEENAVYEKSTTGKDEVLELVLGLPDKYKIPVYLYYYEGYNSREISRIWGKPESTIRTYLQKAKKMLKEELE